MDPQHEMENFVEVFLFLSIFFSLYIYRNRFSLGDILVYVNDTNVLGYSHTDVVRIFQSLSVNDVIRLTVCRGYPLVVNFDDPQIDVVSVNGVHNSVSINNLPNGGYTEYQPEPQPNVSPRIYNVKIRKGDSGFGFTVADSPSGQRVKAIVDRQRCQDLCENDLLLSINGQDLLGKHHNDVVDILIKCSKDMETIFVIRRGKKSSNFYLDHEFRFFLYFDFDTSLIVNEEENHKRERERRERVFIFVIGHNTNTITIRLLPLPY